MFQHPDARPLRVTTEDGDGAPVELATAAQMTALQASIGSPDDAAWDGVAAEASVISLLKAIALNTAPA